MKGIKSAEKLMAEQENISNRDKCVWSQISIVIMQNIIPHVNINSQGMAYVSNQLWSEWIHVP